MHGVLSYGRTANASYKLAASRPFLPVELGLEALLVQTELPARLWIAATAVVEQQTTNSKTERIGDEDNSPATSKKVTAVDLPSNDFESRVIKNMRTLDQRIMPTTATSQRQRRTQRQQVSFGDSSTGVSRESLLTLSWPSSKCSVTTSLQLLSAYWWYSIRPFSPECAECPVREEVARIYRCVDTQQVAEE